MKFITKKTLHHDGHVYLEGEIVELSDKQAEALILVGVISDEPVDEPKDPVDEPKVPIDEPNKTSGKKTDLKDKEVA